MKPTIEQIGELLALKRNERPEEGYWQDFVREFHQNQREQSGKVSGMRNFFSQISDWFSEMGPAKWAYGAGLAYAAVTLGFFLMPHEATRENTPASPVKYQPAVEQLNQLDLNPTTQGLVGETSFLIPATPKWLTWKFRTEGGR